LDKNVYATYSGISKLGEIANLLRLALNFLFKEGLRD